jgi:hypothetical protein
VSSYPPLPSSHTSHFPTELLLVLFTLLCVSCRNPSVQLIYTNENVKKKKKEEEEEEKEKKRNSFLPDLCQILGLEC